MRVYRPWWARSKWTYIPLVVPVVSFRVAVLVVRSAQEATRSAYKGTKRQVRRVRRRRTNKRVAGHDNVLNGPMPKVTERNREASYFLRLPLELRQLIYDYHFTPQTLKFSETSDKDYKLSSNFQPHCQLCFGRGFQAQALCLHPTKHILSLPLVCRQLYWETIHYLYERYKFFLGGDLALAMPSFAVFPRMHLDSLRSIELKFCFDVLASYMKTSKLNHAPFLEKSVNPWMVHVPGRSRQRQKWLALWKLLAELPRLERLYVEFIWLPGPKQIQPEELEWIMAPLRRFQRPKPLAKFDVAATSVPEAVSPAWAKAVPYRIVSRWSSSSL